MYTASFLNELRRSKLATVLVVAASVVAAILITQNVSLARHSVHAEDWSFGVAETDVTVDAGRSPLANTAVLTEDIDLLAGDLAQLTSSSLVLRRMAAAVDVQPSQIATQSQLVGDEALQQTDAGQAQRGTQILDAGRRYSLLARVDQQSFVIQLFTQAPNGAKAIAMANAAAKALSQYISSLVRTERIATRRSIVLRQFDAASGGNVDPHLATDVGVVTALVFIAFGLTALVWLRRLRRRMALYASP